MRLLRRLYGLATSRESVSVLVSVLLTLVVGGVLVVINGDNPFVVYRSLFVHAFGSMQNLTNTLAAATPLIFTGLAVGISFRAGVWNIGAEGQLYLGAMGGAIVGVYLTNLWAPMHIALSLAVAMVCGGLWAWIMGFLKTKWNVDEVVTTMMGNYIAIHFTSYLANYPLKPPKAPIGSTDYVQESAQLPQFVPYSTLNAGFVIAIATAVVYWIFYRYTTTGYQMRTVGYNRLFARYAGMPSGRMILWAMFGSGALAGLAGCVEVLGVQYRFVQDMSPNYGFDGILVALLAMNSGPGIVLVAILFGALRSGGLGVERMTNVPSELSIVLTSVLILLVSSRYALVKLFRKERGTRA
jgi:simple sugar transport system permease protein